MWTSWFYHQFFPVNLLRHSFLCYCCCNYAHFRNVGFVKGCFFFFFFKSLMAHIWPQGVVCLVHTQLVWAPERRAESHLTGVLPKQTSVQLMHLVLQGHRQSTRLMHTFDHDVPLGHGFRFGDCGKSESTSKDWGWQSVKCSALLWHYKVAIHSPNVFDN